MTNEKKGELYLISQVLLESWFPIILLFSYKFITPIFAYSITVSIAAIIFLGIIFYKKRFHQFKKKEAYKSLLLSTFFISSVHLLIFIGLQYTSATNMSVIIFLQLLFSFFYFNIIGNEYISKKHIIGAFMMGFGAIVILFPKDLTFNLGDIMILLAAMIAPIGNYYQKKSRRFVGGEVILSLRYILSFPFVLLLAFLIEPIPSMDSLNNAMPYLIFSGVFIYVVSKIFWIEAIYLISITKASALLAFVPPATMLFAYFFLEEVPSMIQLIAILPIVVGGYLITRKKEKENRH